jgi:serine/threonine-protein kinase
MKQVSQAPQRPSSINPEVSPALDAVVMRALEKSPGDRFQSADAFIAALDNALRAGDELSGGTAAFAPLPPAVAVLSDAEAREMDEIEAEERKRRRRLLILAALAILLGILIALALTRDRNTDVPKVTGRSLERAETRLEGEGFKIGEIREVENAAEPETVTEQDPIPGQVEEDCSLLAFFCSKPEVSLTVSKGPGAAKVPSTAGEPLAKASAELEEAGFRVQVDRVNSAEVAEGLVVHSNPSGGSSATRGTTVLLSVSSGPKLAKVPVLVGFQAAMAEQQIRAAGFRPSVSEVPDSAPEGQVIRQTPSAGSQIEPGSAVSIVVSEGEETATVPNVIGKLRPDAVSALREAGLDPKVSEQETNVPSKVGKVTDQFPPPGSEVAPGAAVTIVVGKAPPSEPIEPIEAEE